MGNKVRVAGKALREARQDNNSDCTLTVALSTWMLKALRNNVCTYRNIFETYWKPKCLWCCLISPA